MSLKRNWQQLKLRTGDELLHFDHRNQAMIHIRVDDFEPNDKRKFACGIGPALPPGDSYFFQDELGSLHADCPGCNPDQQPLGTPISQLSGRPGEPGFAAFCEIARSWGHE